MRALVLAMLALAGCVESATSICSFRDADGNELRCPEGTVCAQLSETENACVQPEEIAACEGMPDRATCSIAAEDPASPRRCYGVACLPRGCGNGRLDVEEDEVCDDANAITGDGCSASCLSNETCGNGLVDPFVEEGAAEQCDDGNRDAFDGCAPSCVVERATWTKQHVLDAQNPLAGRSGHVAIYNPRHEHMLVFGGGRDTDSDSLAPIGQSLLKTLSVDAETWIWDDGWRRLAVSFSPGARWRASAAYDVGRDRVVMFGGQGRFFGDLGDTWEWDGRQWEPRATSVAPVARYHAAMAHDPRRGISVLYGGLSNGGAKAPEDTWHWDGKGWTENEVTGPGPQVGHAMAYDPVRGHVLLVGQDRDKPYLSRVWSYDGVAWTEIATDPLPEGRRGAALAFDAATGTMKLFGGISGDTTRTLNDVWSWDGTTWTKIVDQSNASPRLGATLVTALDRGRTMLLFGGVDPFAFAAYADLHTWDSATGTWQLRVSASPLERQNHDAVLDPLRHRVVDVSGGPNEVWELDGGWQLRGASPIIGGHALVYDEARQRTLMFGGLTTGGLVSDQTFTWNGVTWTEVLPSRRPPRRRSHGMAYDAGRREAVVFGGFSEGVLPEVLDDTWVCDGTTWTDRMVATRPASRAGHAMAHDPIRKVTVLFGGQDRRDPSREGDQVAQPLSDTWEWNGVAWTKLSPPLSPLARSNAMMAWHAGRRRVVLFGGEAAADLELDDTWEWDGTTWTRIDVPVPPPPRTLAAMTSTPDGDGLVLTGGKPATNDVWVLRWSSEASLPETCSGLFDADGDDLRGCADPSCWHLCDPLCGPGEMSCATDRPRCGDGTCAGFETNRNCSVDCKTTTTVCGDFVCDANETCPGDCP